MPATVEVECDICKVKFCKLLKYVTADLKNGKFSNFCSKACVDESFRKPKLKLTCHTCGAKFERLSEEHKGSKSGFYFCSRSCSASFTNSEYKTGENHPRYTDGSFSYRDRSIKDSCQECGEKRPYLLVVHHRNRDKGNNTEENLETLCYNCHATRHLVLAGNKLVVRWDILTSQEAKALM